MPMSTERFSVQRAAVSASALGDNTIVTAVPGRRIVVVNWHVVNAVATAQAITWKSGASTSLTGAMALQSAVGGSLGAVDDGSGLFETAPGQALVLNLSAATAVGGYVTVAVPF